MKLFIHSWNLYSGEPSDYKASSTPNSNYTQSSNSARRENEALDNYNRKFQEWQSLQKKVEKQRIYLCVLWTSLYLWFQKHFRIVPVFKLLYLFFIFQGIFFSFSLFTSYNSPLVLSLSLCQGIYCFCCWMLYVTQGSAYFIIVCCVFLFKSCLTKDTSFKCPDNFIHNYFSNVPGIWVVQAICMKSLCWNEGSGAAAGSQAHPRSKAARALSCAHWGEIKTFEQTYGECENKVCD